MEQKYKTLWYHISRAYDSLEIWAQVYEITNPITEFRLKAKKVLFVLYMGLALPNFLFLMIFICDGIAITFASALLIVKIFVYFVEFSLLFTLFGFIVFYFRFILQCYTITGYKSIWLFIIAFFIPQIFCAVCSTIYVGL